MSDNDKEKSVLGQIIVAFVIIIIVFGIAPWWWVRDKDKGSSPSSRGVSRPGTAIVFDPPSNVKKDPNGEILCSVRKRMTIKVYGSIDSWYYTDICGTMGVIHYSQIKF